MAETIGNVPGPWQQASMGAVDAFAVTPSDTVNFTQGIIRGLYIGGAGDVTLIPDSGTAVLFKAVPVGTILPVLCTRVNATATTATNIVGLV